MEELVKINTTRFGKLEVDKKDILNLKDGLLGFENLKRFFIVDPGDQTLILWLQSLDDEKMALPIIEPRIFQPDYIVKLLPSELASLDLQNLSNASVYTVLTIPQDVTEMSANLKAPIVINNETKSARQIVLQDSKLEVRHKMYLSLKQYIVTIASDDSKRTNVNVERQSMFVSTKTAETTTEEKTQTTTRPVARELQQ